MKKLKSIVMGVFLILAAAVPVFAMDGVFTAKLDENWSLFDKKIDGNYVIWSNSGIQLYDIKNNSITAIGPARSKSPGISGNTAIWYDYDLGGVVKYDISSGEKVLVRDDRNSPYGFGEAVIHGNWVAWMADIGPQVYNLITGQTTTLPNTTEAQYLDYPVSIYGDKIVYLGSPDVYMYDLKTSVETSVGIACGPANTRYLNPTIDGKYIWWQCNSEIKAYNLSTSAVETVLDLTVTSAHKPLTVFDGKLYFSADDTNGNWSVFYTDAKTKVTGQLITSATYWESYYPVASEEYLVVAAYEVTGGVYNGSGGTYLVDITTPSEEVYSVNATSNTVTVINPYRTDDLANTGDDRIVATITTGAGPSDTALSPDETKLYILNSTDKTVTIAQTYDFVPVINPVNINPTNKQTATAVAGDNDSNTYVALKNSSGAGVVKKITSAGVETTLTVGVNPNGLKISPDNKKLLVSNGSSSNVTAIDLATFTIIEGNIATGGGPKIVRP